MEASQVTETAGNTTVKMGRPTTYKPIYAERILQYFEEAAVAPPRELPAIETSDDGYDSKGPKGSQKREVRRICAELPTIEGFSRSIGIPSKTVRGWAEDHADFGAAYARAKDIQFQLLIDRGMTRQYDPTAFMFVAKNITNMTDKQVQEHVGAGGAPLAPLQVVFIGAQPLPAAAPAAPRELPATIETTAELMLPDPPK